MAGDRIDDLWGQRTPYPSDGTWPVRVDEHYEDGTTAADVQQWVPTASLLHSNGDAMDIAVADGRIVGVRGRAEDRVNHGRLDIKDLHAWSANRSTDRLTAPQVRREGELVETDWDTAMDTIVARCRHEMETKGPRAIGFYTSGQLFAEEYYTLATLARAGPGTNHLDGNTRLCTATAGEALKGTRAERRRPTGLGGARAAGRRRARHRGRRPGGRHHGARKPPRRDAVRHLPARRRLRPVPLRLLGHRPPRRARLSG